MMGNERVIITVMSIHRMALLLWENNFVVVGFSALVYEMCEMLCVCVCSDALLSSQKKTNFPRPLHGDVKEP